MTGVTGVTGGTGGTGGTGVTPLPADAAAYVEDYLADVRRRLPGGRRTRQDAVDEIRDGLIELFEHDPPPTRDRAAARAAREFGDPTTVAAGLAGELRLRLARRHALWILLLLVTAGAGWHAYHTSMGMPTSLIPEPGWTRSVFLTSVGLLPMLAGAAQFGTALLAISLSVRAPRLATSRLPAWLAGGTLAAVTAFLAATLLGLATSAPTQLPVFALVSLPFLVVMLLVAGSAHRAFRYLLPAR